MFSLSLRGFWIVYTGTGYICICRILSVEGTISSCRYSSVFTFQSPFTSFCTAPDMPSLSSGASGAGNNIGVLCALSCAGWYGVIFRIQIEGRTNAVISCIGCVTQNIPLRGFRRISWFTGCNRYTQPIVHATPLLFLRYGSRSGYH